MNFSNQIFRCIYAVTCVCASLFSISGFAETTKNKAYEITPFLGQMVASDLTGDLTGEELSLGSASNYGIAFAWQDSPNGQGQLMLNFVSHDFNSEATDNLASQKHSFDVIYAHFNGVAQFRQRSYVTTVSLGLGGTYIDTDSSDVMYPSMTAAIGTRYEFNDNVSLVTEIRAYASLVDEDDDSFCSNDVCSAQFDDTVWIDTAVNVGIAYKF